MSRHTSIRLQPGLADRLKDLAELKRCTFSHLVNEAVIMFLNKEDQIGQRLDATRNAIDHNHDEMKTVMTELVGTMKKEHDKQLIKLGELIAMLASDMKTNPPMDRRTQRDDRLANIVPSSSADVLARIEEIERQRNGNT